MFSSRNLSIDTPASDKQNILAGCNYYLLAMTVKMRLGFNSRKCSNLWLKVMNNRS